MASPALEAILPWHKGKDPALAWALRELRSGRHNITAMTLLVPYLNFTIPAWRQLEDRIYRLLPRPLLRGCDTQLEILEDIHQCLRSALSTNEHLYAMWILYLAERERIPLVNQRYWRQLDQIITSVPLVGESTSDAIIFVSNAMGALHQRDLIKEYLYRLITEERWELVMRFYRLPLADYYTDALRMLPSSLISEMIEYLRNDVIIDYSKDVLANR